MILTAKQWARRGYRIRTGQRCTGRGYNGEALFKFWQVTPWEYQPMPIYKSKTPEYVTVDGKLYRKV